jgi:DNA-binding transcriptional regulator YhcF (GntR family)
MSAEQQQMSSPRTAEIVMAHIRAKADSAGSQIVEISPRAVAAEIGIARQTAYRAFRYLEARGRICRKVRGTGAGYASVWEVTA